MKKILRIFSKKRRKRNVLPAMEKGSLKVRIIEPDSLVPAVVLGVSDERVKELEEWLDNRISRGGSLAILLVELSEECTHINEFALMSVSIGYDIGVNDRLAH